MITIDVEDKEIEATLKRLKEAGSTSTLRESLKGIGEALVKSTKDRFNSSSGPDGAPWPPLAKSTLIQRLTQSRGTRPLVDSGNLRRTIHAQIAGGDLLVGTDRFAEENPLIAPALHFGSRDGRIPARPFLGISHTDAKTIESTLYRELNRLMNRKN